MRSGGKQKDTHTRSHTGRIWDVILSGGRGGAFEMLNRGIREQCVL